MNSLQFYETMGMKWVIVKKRSKKLDYMKINYLPPTHPQKNLLENKIIKRKIILIDESMESPKIATTIEF